MGGIGSGGSRAGAGRKRRDKNASWLAGSSKRPGPRGVAKAAQEPAEKTDDPECPKDASPEVAAVWKQLAPHAIAERTLTHRTALAFLILCRNMVLEQKLAAAPLTCAGPDHRGMMTRVEVGWARFRLVPDGKPVVGDEQSEDEWSEFDGPRLVKSS